jgi:hypothetical protein
MPDDPASPPRPSLEIPELEVVILDRAGLERVFVELAFETTVLGVLVKGGTTERARAESPSLGTAREVMLAGEATGLQIHYVHLGVEWWATLMRAAGSIRLVRVRRQGIPEP